jgi:hypothetical protein
VVTLTLSADQPVVVPVSAVPAASTAQDGPFGRRDAGSRPVTVESDNRVISSSKDPSFSRGPKGGQDRVARKRNGRVWRS